MTILKNNVMIIYLKHRNEPRGVGGIFFDNLNNHKLADCHDFVIKVGECFYTTYSKILKKERLTYSEKHKSFQLFRRGRYVEFNLVYDEELFLDFNQMVEQSQY